MTDHERIPLVLVAAELVQHGYTTKPPLYRELHTAIADGRIPAERDNGRWYIQPRNFPLIVQALCHPSTLPSPRPRSGEPAPQAAAKRRAPDPTLAA